MLTFLKHKFTKKEKFFVRWSAIHVIGALIAGLALTAWLLGFQAHNDQARVLNIKEEAAQSVEAPTSLPPQTGKVGGPFSLTNQDGKPVDSAEFNGKYLLVYFGYTLCPDMCPTGLQSISRALDQLKGDSDKVQPLFITVDPARDTPQRLKEYDSSFHPKIIGLTGSPEQIAAVAKEYQVFYQKGEGDEDYEVQHSSLIYLMDPSGNLITTFDEEVDPHLIVAALQKAMSPQP